MLMKGLTENVPGIIKMQKKSHFGHFGQSLLPKKASYEGLQHLKLGTITPFDLFLP